DYITSTILRPLGMTSTTLEPGDVPRSKLALGYRWEDDTWKEEPILGHGSFGSLGGLLTAGPVLPQYVPALPSPLPPRCGAEPGPSRRACLREMQQVWRPSPGTVTRDASGRLQMNIGGYAFGLRVWQTCAFQHVVAHSGGLPGYGSQMRWLPEYGIGIIAF